MRALFIGGTGTISMAITKLLSTDPNWELFLLNRSSRTDMLPPNVHSIIADISNEADCKEKLKNLTFDVVCNFIAFTPDQVEQDYRLFHGKTKQYISVRLLPIKNHSQIQSLQKARLFLIHTGYILVIKSHVKNF